MPFTIYYEQIDAHDSTSVRGKIGDAGGYDLITLPSGERTRVFTKQEFRIDSAGQPKPAPSGRAGGRAARGGRTGGARGRGRQQKGAPASSPSIREYFSS